MPSPLRPWPGRRVSDPNFSSSPGPINPRKWASRRWRRDAPLSVAATALWQDLDRAVHERVDDAHELEGRSSLCADHLGERRSGLVAGEPRVALLVQVALGVPAGLSGRSRVLRRSPVLPLDPVPVGDREADVTRGEAVLLLLHRPRPVALLDQRERVRT